MTGNPKLRPMFQASMQNDGTLELMIYGDIVDAYTISMLEAWGYSTDGMVSALNVKKALDEAGTGYSKIRIRINSPGGDAFEGIAIHALLSSQPKPVEAMIDGIAASAASIIAMAGNTRTMGRSAMMMIHKAWGCCCGNSTDMRKTADTFDKVDESIAEAYVARTGKAPADVLALMAAETWMSAQDCVEQGFATGVVEQPAEEAKAAMAMAQRFQALAKLKHVPAELRPAAAAEVAPPPENTSANAAATECECVCQACQDGDCTNCNNQDCQDVNCKDCPMQAEPGNHLDMNFIAAMAAAIGLRARV